MMNSKKTGIVDVIVFFEPYGVQLLDFRVNLLKDYVDWFIVTEADRTQTGEPIDFKFEEVVERLDLPMDKIIYVKQHIPEDSQLEIKEVDIGNVENHVYETEEDRLQLIYTRVRERMQKDAMLKVLNEFDDSTVFILGDHDEIMKPSSIGWVSELVRNNPNEIIRIPNMERQGRADLQVLHPNGHDKIFLTSLFMAMPHHLREYTPLEIRCVWYSSHKYPVRHPHHNGVPCHDLAWHFSWMGTARHRLIKRNNYIHRDEIWNFSDFKKNNTDEYISFLRDTRFHDGAPAPNGISGEKLKKVSLYDLPDLMFTKREYIEFFFGLD